MFNTCSLQSFLDYQRQLHSSGDSGLDSRLSPTPTHPTHWQILSHYPGSDCFLPSLNSPYLMSALDSSIVHSLHGAEEPSQNLIWIMSTQTLQWYLSQSTTEKVLTMAMTGTCSPPAASLTSPVRAPPHSLCSCHKGCLTALKHTRHMPSMPGRFFSKRSTWLIPSQPSGLCSNVILHKNKMIIMYFT